MLDRTDLDFLGPLVRGKVRDVYRVDAGTLALVATDRLSAFDRVVGLIPHKGEVLTRLSAWWFDQLADIVPSHLLEVPDPAVSIVRACTALPVEVVVRGALTGVTSTSLWPRYRDGARELYGVRLPDGLAEGDPLPTPIITPTTKAQAGAHDEPISSVDVVRTGLVDADRWEEVCTTALAVFRRGVERASAAGLVLVDTKYEFGVDADGRLRLIDEVHTPDSSRFWRAGTRDHLDKELVRRWFAEAGYRGDGDAPALPADLVAELARRIVEVFERLTGTTFEPGAEPAVARVEANLRRWKDRTDGGSTP